jgi:hypothetical protein
MRHAWSIGLAVLVLGCFGPERPASFWAEQIDRTNLIPDPNVRALTLERTAESAAYAGDAIAAKYALAQLGNGPQRDELVSRCVGHLAVRDPNAARLLAREIDDRERRKEVLTNLDRKTEDDAPRATALTTPANPQGSASSR